MPEIFVRFDKADAEIIGEDYVDLAMLSSTTFDAFFVAHGQKPILSLVGMTPEEHELLNQEVPEHMRRPWRDEDSPWTEAETGLSMCAKLRRAMVDRPEDFDEWPGMVSHVIEILEPFERVLSRAKSLGARFQLFSMF
ncbi:MAG: hypothetical protein AAGA70_19430 [Pseudomonadota bacterium]